jgi:hypothetical protein
MNPVVIIAITITITIAHNLPYFALSETDSLTGAEAGDVCMVFPFI